MTSEQRKAIHQVVLLLVASITAGLVFALLTLLFRHDVLAYQQARDPSARAATLWTRPIPILLVAAFYTVVIRKFRAGSPRALRRIRVVSALGFAAVAWLLFSAAYPVWLRPVQAVQLLLTGALIVAVNRPAVRSAFPPITDARPRNRRAALTLAVLSPAIAEVSLGTVALRQAWVMLLYIPIYGAGAVLVRELVRRTGAGVPGLLLLGVAYGLVEEGLALQSLTSPHLYGAADWAPRLLGFNTAYAELNLPYHAVFSITIPVLVVERLFATHGKSPYLRRAGLLGAAAIALLGAALLRATVPPTEDPGYTMPPLAVLTVLAAITLTTTAALRRRPERSPAPALTSPTAQATPTAHASPTARPAIAAQVAENGQPAVTRRPLATGRAAAPGRGSSRVPRPLFLAVGAALAAFGFMGLIWPFGSARQPMFTHGAWAFVPMAGAAAIGTATFLGIRHWAASAAWTPSHTMAACFGAMVAHTCFGLAANADTAADRLFLLTIVLITAAAGLLLTRRRPAPAPSPTARVCSDAATPV